MERPAFRQALERAERGETRGIVVAKIDRFARSLPAALKAIQRLEDAGAEFVSVVDPARSSSGDPLDGGATPDTGVAPV